MKGEKRMNIGSEHPDHAVIFLRGIDNGLKAKFKAWCCLQNKTMTEVLVRFMEKCIESGGNDGSLRPTHRTHGANTRRNSHSLTSDRPDISMDGVNRGRFTIFGQSLTSVVKAMRFELGMSLEDVEAVVNQYATPAGFARRTVTTAYSDAMNDTYRRRTATLTEAHRRLIRQSLKSHG